MTIVSNPQPTNDLLVSQLMIYAQELHSVYKAARYQYSELDEAKKRLTELDVTKSNFVHLVSHELRTPVAVVAGYVEILEEMLTGRLEGAESGFLKTVYRQTQQLSTLVQQLTEFSQFATEALPIQLPSTEADSDLAAILRSELSAIEAAELKLIQFQLQIPTELPIANLEPTRFRLIVRYLLSNAVKFNTDNGWIKVSLQTLSEQAQMSEVEIPQINTQISDETQTLVLEIGNSGAIIPPDKLKMIFESFQQVENVTNRRQGGLGIGLTIVCRAVMSLSGSIDVRSDEDGTFFVIKLPYRLWEDPRQLKQKLQQMQSLVLSYAQDLRQLYNAERERREQLDQANLRLNAVISALLSLPCTEQQPEFDSTRFEEILNTFISRFAQANNWQATLQYNNEVENAAILELSPLHLALTKLVFHFLQTILHNLSIFSKTDKVAVKLEHKFQHLNLYVQYWQASSQNQVTAYLEANEQTFAKSKRFDVERRAEDNNSTLELETNFSTLKQQVLLLGGTYSFEKTQATSSIVTIII